MSEHAGLPTGFVVTEEAWLDHANCRGLPSEVFFPPRGHSTRPALAVCAACTVTTECADYADRIGAKAGIWGGKTGNERRRRRQRAT